MQKGSPFLCGGCIFDHFHPQKKLNFQITSPPTTNKGRAARFVKTFASLSKLQKVFAKNCQTVKTPIYNRGLSRPATFDSYDS